MALATTLTNNLLIAMPALTDPSFFQTVTYICEHNEKGATGIIVNRPMGVSLKDVFAQMNIQITDNSINKTPVLYGGPMHQERGFVIHRPFGKWRSTLNISDEICVTTSQDVLEAIAQGKGPKEFLIALGYASWTDAQLESEIAANSWLNATASTDLLFHTEFSERWVQAAKLIGVDINEISSDIGHA